LVRALSASAGFIVSIDKKSGVCGRHGRHGDQDESCLRPASGSEGGCGIMDSRIHGVALCNADVESRLVAICVPPIDRARR
jgi:hypothetical protein